MPSDSQIVAQPLAAVDIYPVEGGGPSFTLTGGQILALEMDKDIRGGGVGTCQITLAPGGPAGIGFPSWAQVITLQSLVVVALQRGSYSNVVFVGNVRAVNETQEWQPGARVVRVTTITAVDWQGWFQDFNWDSLSFLAVTNGVAEAAVAGISPYMGLVDSVLAGGQKSGNPAQIAQGWLTEIMGGNQGILSQTQIPYGQKTLLWPAATTSWFEQYPYGTVFPMSFWYISQAGNWYSKFLQVLQPPWYELIVGTAPEGTWFTPPPASGPGQPFGPIAGPGTNTTDAGQQPAGPVSAISGPGSVFVSKTLPGAIPAQAQIVGRLMPMPDLVLTGADSGTLKTQAASGFPGGTAYSFEDSANMGLWNALPFFEPDFGQGFIESSVTLTLREYYNFFILNPTFYRSILDSSHAAWGIFLTAYSGAADVASIHRYGFKSLQLDTGWYSDVAQIASQSTLASGNGMENLVAIMTTRLATYYEPLPLMYEGSIAMPLRPDIFPGCRFIYSPFRGDEPWVFYICGVRHRWAFGGPSTTEMSLDRGLPRSVYDDAGTMAQVLRGNAQRVSGGIHVGLPAGSGPPLQTVGMATKTLQTVLGEIAGIYATPQGQ